jgi:uncharacterized protein (TIGR02246 family)
MVRTTLPKQRLAEYLLIIVLCATSGSLAADEITTVSDRLAIAEMLAQYSYRWDSKDSAGFADLFTEDGVMERWLDDSLVPNSRVAGKEAIYQYAKQSHEGRLADRQTRHHFSALVFLDLATNTAVTENMALITHQTADDSAAFIRSSGIYRNSWEKTVNGWRISKRVLFTDSFTPKR